MNRQDGIYRVEEKIHWFICDAAPESAEVKPIVLYEVVVKI